VSRYRLSEDISALDRAGPLPTSSSPRQRPVTDREQPFRHTAGRPPPRPGPGRNEWRAGTLRRGREPLIALPSGRLCSTPTPKDLGRRGCCAETDGRVGPLLPFQVRAESFRPSWIKALSLSNPPQPADPILRASTPHQDTITLNSGDKWGDASDKWIGDWKRNEGYPTIRRAENVAPQQSGGHVASPDSGS